MEILSKSDKDNWSDRDYFKSILEVLRVYIYKREVVVYMTVRDAVNDLFKCYVDLDIGLNELYMIVIDYIHERDLESRNSLVYQIIMISFLEYENFLNNRELKYL